MNEGRLIKRIRQLEDHIKELEEREGDDTLRKDIINRNQILIKYYRLQLKEIKWRVLLEMGRHDKETIEQ